MGCFSASKDQELPTLRSILAKKQPGLPPSPSSKKFADQNFCLLTPKVLRARSRLLRSFSQSLARASRRTLSLPASNIVRQEAKQGHSLDDDSCPSREQFVSHSLPITPEQVRPSNDIPATLSGPILSNSSQVSSPVPLLFPLPLPPGHTGSSTTPSSSSFALPGASASARIAHSRGSSLSEDHCFSGPLPLPSHPTNIVYSTLREFTLETIAAACDNFSNSHKLRDGALGPVYKVSIKENSNAGTEIDAVVARVTLNISRKKWKAQVQSIARLAHRNLCKMIGFCYEDTKSVDRQTCKSFRGTGLLVYENPSNGSLDGLLYDKGPKHEVPIDWSTRINIAIGAAEGLAFLHERSPKQITYRKFSINSVQLDDTFNAKLSDFGFTTSISSNAEHSEEANVGDATAEQRDVMEFGVVLRQLFTGKPGSTSFDYVGYGGPLHLGVDDRLHGQYSESAAKVVEDVAAQCLQLDPSLRPSMRHVAQHLRHVAPQNTPLRPSRSLRSLHTGLYKKRRSFSFG